MLGRLIKRLVGSGATRPETSASPELDQGRALFKQDRFMEAETCFRSALAGDPANAAARFYLCVALQRQGRLIEALREGLEAVKARPEERSWQDSIKYISVDAGKAEGVQASRSEAARRPDCAALLALGNALREAELADEAERAYRQAVALEPESPFAWRRLGGLLAAHDRWNEADACFSKSAAAGMTPDHLVRINESFLRGLDAPAPALLPATMDPGANHAAPEDAELVILVSGDSTYIRRFAPALIQSLGENAGLRCLFHAHVLDPEPDIPAMIGACGAGSSVPVAVSSERLPEGLAGDLVKTHCACARFRHLPALLARYNRPVMVLDLDVLVNGPLRLLLQRLGGHDVAMVRWHATRWDPWDALFASVSLYQPSAGGLRFAARASRYVAHFLDSGAALPAHPWQRAEYWFLDQVALFAARAASSLAADCSITWLPIHTMKVAHAVDEIPAASDAESPLWTVTFHVHDRAGAATPAAFTPQARNTKTDLARAMEAYKENRLEDAERLFRDIIQADPANAEAHFYRAASLVKLERSFDAARSALQAFRLAPGKIEWILSITNIVDRAGSGMDTASCQREIEAHGDCVAYLGMGQCLRQHGELQRAEAALRQALALEPSQPFAQRRLASLLAVLGKADEADALYQASAGMRLKPDAMLRLSAAWTEKTARQARSGARERAWAWHAPAPEHGAGLVVYAGGDSAYLRRFAGPLMESIRRNAGEPCRLHLHAIAPEPGLAEDLLARAGRCGLSLALTHGQEPDWLAGLGREARRTYYASVRFLLVPDLMEHYRAPLLLLDLDQLVVGPLRHIRQAMGDGDAGFVRWHPFLYEPWDQFWASMMWFAASAQSLDFARMLAAYIDRYIDARQLQWYLDQCAIFAAQAWARGRGARFTYLPPALAHLAEPGEHAFAPASAVIWSAIASLAEKEPLFNSPPFSDYLV